jgi:4-amino-4-deoxy-L-arabinose transferase-like glycosyltransferase
MSRLRRLFAMLALTLVLAPLVASAPLFDPDEGLHAAIAQEMVQRGDYVTPTFMGEPFLDKPILFFWAEAASLRLFGHHEAAVRIPPLLFGLLGMVTVAMLGRSLFGESAGLIAGIVYGTMLLPMGVSEVAVHDIGLVPFMCVAALCLRRAADLPPAPLAASAFPGLSRVEGRRKIWISGILAGVALGLSILTKGLVGVVFAGIFAMCLAVYRPSATVRLAMVLAIAAGVAAIVAAPWYIAMERAHAGYLHYYFVERHLQGYLTATQRHAGRPWWYYVPIVIGGALPWTAYLAGAASSARANPLRLVVWGWFAIGLVFLSIGESKLVTYALPLFPALAIIIGEHIDRVTASGTRSVRRPPSQEASADRRSLGGGGQTDDPVFTVAFATHAIALALLPMFGLLVITLKFNETRPVRWIGLILGALVVLDTARRAARSASEYGLVDGIVRMSAIAILGLTIVTPRAAAWMTARDLAAALNKAGALPSRVSVVDERIGSLVFYLDPPLRAAANTDRLTEASFAEAIARARVDPADAVLAVRNTQVARFNRLFSSPPVPETTAGTFTLYRAGTLRDVLQGR